VAGFDQLRKVLKSDRQPGGLPVFTAIVIMLRFGCCLAALCVALSLAAGQPERALIEEAIQAADGLPVLDRVFTLLLIAENCGDISPDRSAQLAEQVFDLARKGISGGTQSAMEKNALLVLSRSQPAARRSPIPHTQTRSQFQG